MTLGQRIRERRRQHGLTLQGLAEGTNLSLAYLSDLERDRTPPSLKALRRIADGLGMTVNDLMQGVDELGALTQEALPAGLRELTQDETWGGYLDEEWLRTLQRVDYRGKRPQTKEEWLEVFLALRRIIGKGS